MILKYLSTASLHQLASNKYINRNKYANNFVLYRNINFCLRNGNMIKNVNFLFMTLMSFLVAVEDSEVTPSDYATLIEMVSIV